MKIQHKNFFLIYKLSFFLSKFLINNRTNLFILQFVRYNVETNKYSLLNIFCTILLLFGQVPLIKLYTKQINDKSIRNTLTITKNFTDCFLYLYKLLHFCLLTAATDNYNVKTKNDLDCFKLKDNSYYSELLYFPRFSINAFDISIYISFKNNYFLSFFEKVTIFRILQFPINLVFIQKNLKRRRLVYKKTKVNKVK
jgi:hypothetical protein